jgi:sortase (surface protein transpeptidase)
MHSEFLRLRKFRFFSNVSSVYLLTIVFLLCAIRPAATITYNNVSFSEPLPALKTATANIVIGKPIRVVIPASGIDLPVDDGLYDSSNNTWTLSGYRAHYAAISSPANNSAGDTFIYGHNNNNVFGALRKQTPELGTQALVYTDNGHVFAYKFKSVSHHRPDDAGVLFYNGPPVLTIMTCTGAVDEWRTLFKFDFDKVIQ